MSIGPGTRLGHFQVEAAIGAGGMGEVYRAVDTQLGRRVAIKVLPAMLAEDGERLERLRREARALASVNHPNIATLYGFEESAGVRYLVMELVDGRSLAEAARPDLLATLAIGEQIAGALAAAHDKGIIHRDLKPSNVMLGEDGRVKVLDFGLAKKLPSPADEDVTTLSRTSPDTVAGSLVGTLPYMSPEQIRGQTLDARSDLWAFGCVLYELLAGVRAFKGATTADTVAAILGGAPDLDRLPPSTPPRVRMLIERCLRTDPGQRLHHAADARIELADARAELADGASGRLRPGVQAGPAAAKPRSRSIATAAALGVVAGVVLASAWLLRTAPARGPGDEDAMAFSVPLPAGASIPPGEVATYLAVSPDGHQLAFSGGGARTPLHLHSFRTATTRPIAGTEGAASPVWSPDGRFVAYFAGGQLRKIDVEDGGPPQVVSAGAWEAGSTWSRDGVLLFSQRTNDGIAVHAVPAVGGDPSPVTHVDPEREIAHFWPHMLPDGRRFLYLVIEKSSGEAPVRTLRVASLDDDEHKTIPGVSSRAIYTPGYLLYVVEGSLVARPFDADRAEFTGEPVVVASTLRSFRMTGQAEFSVSQDAARPVLAVHGGPWTNELVSYDRTGRPTATIGQPAPFDQMRISPDGRQLAVAVLDASNGGRDLWVYELATGRARRLTLHPPDEQSPVWSPDGGRIVFRSDVNGPPDLYVQAAGGGGSAEAILSRPTVLSPEDWSRDGRSVLFRVVARATGSDQWVLPLGPDAEPRPLLNTRYSEWGGKLSPDARWVAFVSDESGTSQVYLAPVEDAGARRAVSTDGGVSPRWRADGLELFYLGRNGAMMAVSIGSQASPSIGVPRQLFTLDRPVHVGEYDVSPDGQLFVVNHVVDDVTRSPIRVMLNWMVGGAERRLDSPSPIS